MIRLEDPDNLVYSLGLLVNTKPPFCSLLQVAALPVTVKNDDDDVDAAYIFQQEL